MTRAALDVARVRADFPILAEPVRGRRLVFLDSAASAQKPRAVLDAMTAFYETSYANIHRGVYRLSQASTEAFEGARATVARFLGAASPREIVFTRNATEGINLVAQAWGRANVGAGDEVLVTQMEHHANIVPWQMLCAQTGARLRVVPIDDRGELEMDELAKLLTPRTKLVGVTHVSNALGTINPVKEIAALAHAHGALVLVDGAQAAPHLRIDVADLGCDFYVVTGHKIFGPSGIGALWGRLPLLDAMPPWQGGGDMIEQVTFERTTYAPVPAKFEAGTPAIAEAVGLAAAIEYVEALGLDAIAAHEHDLLAHATERLGAVPGLRIVGTARQKAAVVSFVLDFAHPHDVGTILDQEGIALRTGHHCAQPVMDRYGLPATARASFSIYNGRDDVDALVAGIEKVRELFA
ncbi:MAG: cysteine desulfurase [Myxococcota bacterium]|nr:cysteine desulfurase [Myxococcales bacterium]